MNGTGTQTATVKYTGSYSGEMVPGFLGGTTGVIGNLVVRDMTTEQIIASRTAINETLQNHNGLSYYTNTQSLTSTVTFTAGHTYVIYFSVGASASEFLGEMICASDFFTPDTDYDFGARMNSIKITF